MRVGADPAPLPERVRAACAWVAAQAELVRIDEAVLERYAATLPDAAPAQEQDAELALAGDRELRAAFAVCLDAVNFGSGWWPTIRKRDGLSGYRTIATGLAERFRSRGAWSADELAEIGPRELAAVFGQEPQHPLMPRFAAALRDVGAHVAGEHAGSFAALADAAAGSAVRCAELLSRWRSFADTSRYRGREVPFFKRAQIAAADLAAADVAAFEDLDRLTAFADNLVPHVLRLDGVLRVDPALAAAIERGELLEHGSPAEVELRACGVHAVELLAAATGGRLCPAAIDSILWNRGAAPRYKAVPRHRSRCTAY
jgi:hypothetical protein